MDVIVRSGSELEQNPHTDQGTVHGLMGKIQTFMNDFDQKLTSRKKTLHDSVRLHKLIEAVSAIAIVHTYCVLLIDNVYNCVNCIIVYIFVCPCVTLCIHSNYYNP